MGLVSLIEHIPRFYRGYIFVSNEAISQYNDFIYFYNVTVRSSNANGVLGLQRFTWSWNQEYGSIKWHLNQNTYYAGIYPRLNSSGIKVDETCQRCCAAPESRDLVLFSCPVSLMTWPQANVLSTELSTLQFRLDYLSFDGLWATVVPTTHQIRLLLDRVVYLKI